MGLKDLADAAWVREAARQTLAKDAMYFSSSLKNGYFVSRVDDYGGFGDGRTFFDIRAWVAGSHLTVPLHMAFASVGAVESAEVPR